MTGVAWVDWLIIVAAAVGAVAGIIVSSRTIWRKAFVPMIEAASQLHDAAVGFGQHDERLDRIETRQALVMHKIDGITDAIRPSNGDDRTISARLDSLVEVVDTHVVTDLERFGTLGGGQAEIMARINELEVERQDRNGKGDI